MQWSGIIILVDILEKTDKTLQEKIKRNIG